MKNYARIRGIRVKDFQAIESGTIEPGSLTVICGQGDAGKSSFLRAIRALMLNDSSADDIRHGAKKCEVEMTFEDGVTVLWWRDKKAGGCYKMGDTEYLKTGGAVPEPIAEYLGVSRIVVDSTTELTPQFSDQHDLPHIIWETGSKRARILGKATRLDTVISAQMSCKKSLDQSNRTVEDVIGSLANTEAGLEDIPNYKEIEGEINLAESNLKTLQDNIKLARRAQELADKIEEVRSRAMAVAVAPLYTKLDTAAEGLDQSERLQSLARKIPQLRTSLDTGAVEVDNAREALSSFETQLATACKEAGVCEVCGGLLSHEECGG